MSVQNVTLNEPHGRLWIESHKLGNEMRLERNSRKLFPLLEYRVDADPSKKYLGQLVFRNMANGKESDQILVAKTGQELLQEPLSFAHVGITCDEEQDSGEVILLEKFTKYLPVLRLFEDPEDGTGFKPLCKKVFDHTKFKTVALHSKKIQKFKNENNHVSRSRAKGHAARKNKTTKKPRRRLPVPDDMKNKEKEEEEEDEADQ